MRRNLGVLLFEAAERCGSEGSAAERRLLVTARPCILPAFSCGIATEASNFPGFIGVRVVRPVRPDLPYRTVLRIRTLWWIVLSGMLFNFNAYAINVFQTPFLQRFHELSLRDANMLSGLSLGLAGAIGLLLGGWLGDRLRIVLPTARVLLPAIALLISAPCVVIALQQPKGGVVAFALLMGTSTALSFAYYSTVYSAIQDVVPANLRGTAVSLYFFAMYVLGASFGSTIMGALSDFFAHQAMIAAGATAMADAFRAAGLHNAMHVIPVLMLLCSGSLFGAARTIPADMKRMAQANDK